PVPSEKDMADSLMVFTGNANPKLAADVRKDSSGLDLPIAVGLLASYGMVPETAVYLLDEIHEKKSSFYSICIFDCNPIHFGIYNM
ncbi:MAG: hypothetical protein ACFNVI_06865, partial [Lachnoanaerobaculum gingivalis]